MILISINRALKRRKSWLIWQRPIGEVDIGKLIASTNRHKLSVVK